jgi:hypothetical protein
MEESNSNKSIKKSERKFIEKSQEGKMQKRKLIDNSNDIKTPSKDNLNSYLLITPKSTIQKNKKIIENIYNESKKNSMEKKRKKSKLKIILNFLNLLIEKILKKR